MVSNRWLFGLLLLGLGTGCEKELYGTSTLYIYNGTEMAAEVSLSGRSTAKVTLRAGSGELVRDLIAGPYQIAIIKGGAMGGMLGTELVRDRLTLVNVDGSACFARADIAGMYNPSKAAVHLKQVYQGETLFSIPEEIGVLPGEAPPASRPKSAYSFFRVSVVPCDLVGNDYKLQDYIHKQK